MATVGPFGEASPSVFGESPILNGSDRKIRTRLKLRAQIVAGGIGGRAFRGIGDFKVAPKAVSTDRACNDLGHNFLREGYQGIILVGIMVG